jgi:hypothetical protein
MPVPLVQARGPADLRDGTVWWRVDGRSEACIIRNVTNLQGTNPRFQTFRVQVQFLNNRRFRRYFSLTEFNAQWTHRPRIDLAWLNTGSIWREINYADRHGEPSKASLRRYTLSRVHNGQVTLFKGTPGHYEEVGKDSFDSSGLKVLNFAQHYVRLWPTDEPFPVEPDSAQAAPEKPCKAPSKPRKRKAKPLPPSIWDRIGDDDLV